MWVVELERKKNEPVVLSVPDRHRRGQIDSDEEKKVQLGVTLYKGKHGYFRRDIFYATSRFNLADHNRYCAKKRSVVKYMHFQYRSLTFKDHIHPGPPISCGIMASCTPSSSTSPSTVTCHSSTTREPPARVDPQDNNPDPHESGETTRDDADKEREDEYVCTLLYHITGLTKCSLGFSNECRLKARWINLAISFGIEIHDIFKVGMRLNIFVNNVDEESDSDSDMYVVMFLYLF